VRTPLRSRFLVTAALAGLAMVVPAAPAHAEILVTQTRTDGAVFGGATYFVDFNGGAAGGTQFTFETAGPNRRVIIIFNAECAHQGVTTNYVDIDILVDPAGPSAEAAIAPSNGDNAFCSGNGTTTGGDTFLLDGWTSVATVATVMLPQAGTHTVRIRLDGRSSVTRLDDMSLVVFR
jgi:hypothetical protein